MSRIFFALLLVCSLQAHANEKVFRVWSSPLAHYVPVEQYGKPHWTWSTENTLLVQVVVQASSSLVVDESSGIATVKGQEIQLCYRMQQVKHSKNQPIAAAAFPQVMEYLVPNLSPSVKFSFVVKKDCK